MAVKFRNAEPNEKDCGDILGLLKELASYGNYSDDVKITVEELIGGMKAGYYRGLLAVSEDEVAIGLALWFIQYFADGRKTLFIEDLYVKPSHRRGGVGEAIVRHLMTNDAKQLGLTSMTWVALSKNQLALDFYAKKLGAEVVSTWHHKRITVNHL